MVRRIMGGQVLAEEEKAGRGGRRRSQVSQGAKKCLTLIKTWTRNGGAQNVIHWFIIPGMITQSHQSRRVKVPYASSIVGSHLPNTK